MQDEALLMPWSYRILRNAIADLHRQRAGQGHPVRLDIDEVAASPADTEIVCRWVLCPVQKAWTRTHAKAWTRNDAAADI